MKHMQWSDEQISQWSNLAYMKQAGLHFCKLYFLFQFYTFKMMWLELYIYLECILAQNSIKRG